MAAQSGLHLSPTFFHPFFDSSFVAVVLLLRLLFWAVIWCNRARVPFSLCLSAAAVQPLASAGTWLLGLFLFPFQGVSSSVEGTAFARASVTVALCNEKGYIKYEPNSRASSGLVFSCKGKNQWKQN